MWMQEMDLDLTMTMGINNPSTHNDCGFVSDAHFLPF